MRCGLPPNRIFTLSPRYYFAKVNIKATHSTFSHAFHFFYFTCLLKKKNFFFLFPFSLFSTFVCRFLQAMEMVLKKGTAAIRAFFKRPHKHGQIVLCYIGLYTILQLQLVSARHHDLGKLLAVSSSSENINFNEKELQQNTNAQINHSHENVEQSPIIKQQPILGQKITQQTPGSDIGPSGAVLSKDDGELIKIPLITL